MAPRFRARNGIEREKFRCTRCGRRLITASQKQTRSMAKSGRNVGFAKRKSRRLNRLHQRRRHRHASRLKSKGETYAIDAKTREVSEVPARKSQGDCFA